MTDFLTSACPEWCPSHCKLMLATSLDAIPKEVEVMGWFAEKPDKTLQNDINKVCGVVIYYTYIRIYGYTDI